MRRRPYYVVGALEIFSMIWWDVQWASSISIVLQCRRSSSAGTWLMGTETNTSKLP